jgi:rRNA-processing protein FCF1
VTPDDGKRNPDLYYRVIDLLESLIQDQNVEIVVPEVIIQELMTHDNKLRQGIMKAENRKRARLKEFRSFNKNLIDEDKILLEQIAKKIDKNLDKDVELAESYHQRVKDIINSSRK